MFENFVGFTDLRKKKTDKTREEETAELVITSSIIGQTVISPIKSLGLSSIDCIGIGCHLCSITISTI